MENERLPEELGVDYVARRLRDVGIELSPYVNIDEGEWLERQYGSGPWKISLSVNGPNNMRGGVYEGREFSGLLSSTKLEDLLEPLIRVDYFDQKTREEGELWLKLEGDQVVANNFHVGSLSFVESLGPLKRYTEKWDYDEGSFERENLGRYPLGEFTNDLVNFAQLLTLER